MVQIKRTLRHSMWICGKDLLELFRNRLGLVMLILMPILMMVMVGFIFPSGTSLSNTPVAIANLDDGPGGTAFISALEGINNQTGMFNLRTAVDFDEIKVLIQEGEISAGIIIPENFTIDLLMGKQVNISLIVDQSNPQMSATIQVIMTQVIQELGTLYAMYTLNLTYAEIVPYNVNAGGIVPGNPSYFEFMAPGIMAMVVMMALMTGLPHAISYEKDMGTLDGMLVAPINRLSIILGKTLAQTARGMIQGIILLILAVLLFNVKIYGSILLVFLLLFLIVFSFTGLGITITSFTKNEQTASMIMMTLMFPMMFFSGVFFPIQQMPPFMQGLAKALPLTYGTDALRNVMVLGASITEILGDVIFLLIFGIVFLIIAIPLFKRAMRE